MRAFLVVVSAAFLVFSAVYGDKYSRLRSLRGSIYGNSYQEAEARIVAAQDDIHEIVRPVSVVYYLLGLGFFVKAARYSAWRKLSILGAVACLFMTVWSLAVDRGASFDEVYPAWIVAAVVIVVLELVVLPRAPRSAPETAAA